MTYENASRWQNGDEMPSMRTDEKSVFILVGKQGKTYNFAYLSILLDEIV